MSGNRIQTFTAVLEPDRTRLKWVIARIPFDPAEVWPVRKGLRVRGEISTPGSKGEGFAFRTSLFSGPGKGRMLMVNKKMLAGAKAAVGSLVKISLEPDLEERIATLPPELARALKGDPRLPKWFAKLSYSNRKEVAGWVTEPENKEARQQRAERMAERLLLTLEGEIEPPPILQAAFLRQPLARKGWEAMTDHQRRGHLLGIFGYQSVESRERRAAKAVEEALRVAQRG
ncbi:MAG: YdeI/OmpD-associated family protein [Terracidiphilus sp.]